MKFLLPIIIILVSCTSNKKQTILEENLSKDDPIIGVKIYKQQDDYLALFSEWKEIGINTAYVSVALAYDSSFRLLAKKNKIMIYIVLPVFYDAEILREHPDWYAITQNNELAKEEWVEFINPSNEEYRSQKIAFINKVVENTNPDGLSIDFIRYFAFWEKIYEDRTLQSIPNTSFDSTSLATFQATKRIIIPDEYETVSQKAAWILENHENSWIDWKCNNIETMVSAIVTSAKAIQPNLLINLHIVPWRENDFGGAIKKIVGQDISHLSKFTDYLSPMCYSHMLKREPDWVSSVVKDFDSQTNGTSVLPSIQVKEAYLEDVLTDEEFKNNLKAALEFPSKGVVFWSWDHLEQDQSKKEIIKETIEKLVLLAKD